MKKLLRYAVFSIALALVASGTFAQKFSKLQVSPGDVAYYPQSAVFDGKTSPVIKVTYFRPLKKGREIFGSALVPYGKVWRAGANNETEIKFFKDVKIGGVSVPAGTYSLFVIPTATEWTFIVNKQTDRWGAYSYDEKLDVVRVKAPVKKTEAPLEALSIGFAEAGGSTDLQLGWDNSYASLPITL